MGNFGDEVEVTVGRLGDSIRITGIDDGDGIEADIAERIFDPYYTTDLSRASPGAIGLGFHVARRLARAMNGDLTCERRDGLTMFRLVVPEDS